jgi:hypothetical protein
MVMKSAVDQPDAQKVSFEIGEATSAQFSGWHHERMKCSGGLGAG